MMAKLDELSQETSDEHIQISNIILPTTNEWKISKLEAFTEVLNYVIWLEIMWHI